MNEQIRKIEVIRFAGGLIGSLINSGDHFLNTSINKNAQDGYTLVSVTVRNDINLFTLALQAFLLVFTFGLISTGGSYLAIYEKTKQEKTKQENTK